MTNGLITFDQYVQEKGFDNKTVNRFWKYCNQDIPNKETGQIEWWGSEATNHNDMQGYPEEFDELFNEFKNINSSRKIQSSYSEYRVGDEVILKTEGDSASRRVTKVIDPNCELRIGDSVSDFSNNVDYLDDVYGGRFVIVPYDRYIQSSITKDEYFNMVKKHKSTNASTPEFRKQELDAITAFPVGTKFAFKENNSWHDVNTVYEKIDDNVWKITQVINGKVNDEYTKSDDEVRIYISDEFGGNAYPTSYVSGYGSINSSRKNNMIKSSPNFKEFTADDIFDSFQVEELTHTVFMDREECKNAKCGMDEFSTCMYDVLPTYLGVYTADDVREVCRKAKNPQAKAFLEAFETAMENAKFTDKFYNSVKVHKKIQSELNHFYDPATDYIDEELTEDEEYKYSQFKVETGYYLTPQRTRVDVYTVYSPNDKYLGQTSNPNEILDLIRGKRVNSSKRNNLIKSDKQFRLIDTEHNDPKDGEDFTAEELRDYISKNDKYFDNVGLDYTIVDLNTGEEMNMSTFRLNSSRQIKSAYTREDYDRFDEVGNFIPYQPTEEELAKKDEIKTVLKQELAAASEPDPMDDYAGYDSTSERMDSAVEKVANQFGVDTDFAWECAGELMNEENARQYEEFEWAQNNLEGDEYDKWYRGELDIRDRIHSSRQIKSSRYDESLLHKENSINTQYIKSQLLSIASKYFPNLRQDRYFKNHIHLDEHYMLDYNCEKRSDYSQGFGEYFIQIYDFDDRTSKVSWAGYGKENFNKDLPDMEQMIKSISSSSELIESELDDKTVRNIELQRKYDDIVNRLAEEERTWNKNHPDKAHYFYNKPKEIKSSIITPWDTNQVTGTSDEDLGLSAVVDMYGNEFVNVDESTLNELKDTLVRYFDDEAYVRDWNINNPDYQIEDASEVTDPEEMNVEDLARYFDYEAYGRDIRLQDNMVWDSENQYWVSAHDVDDEELNDDKYIFMRG